MYQYQNTNESSHNIHEFSPPYQQEIIKPHQQIVVRASKNLGIEWKPVGDQDSCDFVSPSGNTNLNNFQSLGYQIQQSQPLKEQYYPQQYYGFIINRSDPNNSNNTINMSSEQIHGVMSNNNPTNYGNNYERFNQLQEERYKQNSQSNIMTEVSQQNNKLSVSYSQISKKSNRESSPLIQNQMINRPEWCISQRSFDKTDRNPMMTEQFLMNTERQSVVSKEHQENYCKKLYDYDQLYREKKDKIVKEIIRQETEECTFAPKVNMNGCRRSSELFNELQDQFRTKVELKRKEVAKKEVEKTMAEVTGRPYILKKSKQIFDFSKNASCKVEDRLYELAVGRSDNKKENVMKYHRNKDWQKAKKEQQLQLEAKENTFTPSILQKSKSLIRKEKVDKLLYDDAQRRLEKSRENSLSKSSPSQVLLKSESILYKKFERDFTESLLLCKPTSKEDQLSHSQNSSSLIDLAITFELLIKQGFINYIDDPVIPFQNVSYPEIKLVFQLWSIISQPPHSMTNQENLLTFLLSLLGYQRKTKATQFQIQPPIKFLNGTLTHPYLPTSVSQCNQNSSPDVTSNTLSMDIAPKLLMDEPDHQFSQARTNFTSTIDTPWISNNYSGSRLTGANVISAYQTAKNSSPLIGRSQISSSQSVANIFHSCEEQIPSQNQLQLNFQQCLQNTQIQFRQINTNKDQEPDKYSTNCAPKLGEKRTNQSYVNRRSSPEIEKKQSHFIVSRRQSVGMTGDYKRLTSNSKNDKTVDNTQTDYEKVRENVRWIASRFEKEYQQQQAPKVGSFEGGELKLTESDEKYIQKTFSQFNKNKLANEHTKHAKQYFLIRNQSQDEILNSESSQINLSVAGGTSSNRESLAIRKRDKVLLEATKLIETNQLNIKIPENKNLTHFQYLQLERLTQDKLLEQKRALAEQEILRECRFNPQISSSLHKKDSTREEGSLKGESITGIKLEKGIKKSEELYHMAETKVKRRDKTTNEVEFENQADMCTFQPSISNLVLHNNKLPCKSVYVNKDVEKSIERMRQASKEKEYISSIAKGGKRFSAPDLDKFVIKKEAKSKLPLKPAIPHQKIAKTQNSIDKSLLKLSQNMKSSVQLVQSERSVQDNQIKMNFLDKKQSQNFKEIKPSPPNCPENIEQSPSKSALKQALNNLSKYPIHPSISQKLLPTQPSEIQTSQVTIPSSEKRCSTDKDCEKFPLLFVDVNLGYGKSDRIVVFDGDKSEVLAKNFATLHGLDAATELKFKELLDSQIAGVLSKIEEEIVSIESESVINSQFQSFHNLRSFNQFQ